MAEAVSVEAIGVVRCARRSHAAGAASHAARRTAADTVDMHTGGTLASQRRYTGASALQPGDTIAGPAIIAEANATTVVEPDWQARSDAARSPGAQAHRSATRSAPPSAPTVDPVMLEIFNNLYMSIAEQMGLRLDNTAYSVNIKERLDFSCALFDAAGPLDRQRAAHAGASRARWANRSRR